MALGSHSTVPKIAAIALIMVGLGLIGMTAAQLPGIAEQLEAPRWLMGVLGGVLIGAGWQAYRPRGIAGLLRRVPPWVDLVPAGIVGILLARLSDYTRQPDGEMLGIAINEVARILFGVGIGILLGWLAYASTRRSETSSESS